jgi:hypothetical protein
MGNNPSVDPNDNFVEEYTLAKKVNLWQIQTEYGICENMEYFYNTGSLTGDEILQQLLRVILCLETTETEVHMLVMDAGGGNSSLLASLRKDKQLKGSWIAQDCISFINPFDPRRRIFLVTCAVHGEKALRNNHLKSQDGGVRRFEIDTIVHGWEHFVTLYSEDTTKLTRLTRAIIAPDKSSLMSVPDAMIPFEWATICFNTVGRWQSCLAVLRFSKLQMHYLN